MTKTIFMELYSLLVHLASNIIFTNFQLDIELLKKIIKLEISSASLTHSLTTVARLETKWSSTQPSFYDTVIKLTGGKCFLGFQWACSLCALSLLLSSIRLILFFFKRQKPYPHVNFSNQLFPWAAYLDATT